MKAFCSCLHNSILRGAATMDETPELSSYFIPFHVPTTSPSIDHFDAVLQHASVTRTDWLTLSRALSPVRATSSPHLFGYPSGDCKYKHVGQIPRCDFLLQQPPPHLLQHPLTSKCARFSHKRIKEILHRYQRIQKIRNNMALSTGGSATTAQRYATHTSTLPSHLNSS